ncbi:MAG: hypothetical protein ABW199_09795 [Caulobacterales bacterium]
MRTSLAAIIIAAALAAPMSDAGAAARVANSAPVAATAPANASRDRTYEAPADALVQGDLDYLVSEARKNYNEGDRALSQGLLVFLDNMAAGRTRDARRTLDGIDEDDREKAGDLLEPFLLIAERRPANAIERARSAGSDMPAPMPELMQALVYEGAGQLENAARSYAQAEALMDTSPPPKGEPTSVEQLQSMLNAGRTAKGLYRAALVQHRLQHREEALRLYRLAQGFEPHSPDIAANIAQLERNAAPLERALDSQTALSQWLILLADYMGQSEGLAAMLTSEGPVEGLASPVSAMFLQFALVLDPAADDWRIVAAAQLMSAEGYEGAERLIGPVQPASIHGPEADITRASILLKRYQDEEAVRMAERALANGGGRFSVLNAAGDIFRSAGRSREAIAAFDRALTVASNAEERADVLRYRAYAHRFAGDVPAAVQDARAALALDRSDDTRLTYVSILMDDSAAWSDGIREARALFAERPDSVTRLNTLGYALIQKPQGLEEGYRLLWRGFILGERDYAVIDSLGWAYYLHGAFEQARALVERADQLTGHERNFEVLDHLGDIYWRLGRQEDAREAWRNAVRARPDAIRLRDLNAKIERGMATPAPATRTLPTVELPSTQRDDT